MWNSFKRWFSGGRAHGAGATAAPLAEHERALLAERIAGLPALPEAGAQLLRTQPVVVLDLETTGLDRKRDTVLSVGAVRIEGQGIALGRTFDRVLNVQVALQPTSQLFHGLTAGDLAQGEDPRLVLLDLLEWGQDAIWLAWHAWFDEAMLHRAARHWLGLSPNAAPRRLPKVHDLAHAMPLLFAQHTALGADLDAWLAAMQLGNSERHHAVADAMATAELALMALAKADAQGLHTWQALTAAMARSQQQRNQQQAAQQGGF